jgi:NAD(P)-dependent dehydrogenase (short-subunit alcohol dehydrogenase family)
MLELWSRRRADAIAVSHATGKRLPENGRATSPTASVVQDVGESVRGGHERGPGVALPCGAAALLGAGGRERADDLAAREHGHGDGDGALVHIASEAARMPNPRLPDYSVSKAAILMLSKVLAAEFTSDGIRSNVVSPAFIRSPIYDRPGGIADSLAAEFGVDNETALAKYVELNKIPVGRLGTVDEVAGIVVYLASTRASFVSGANFCIDGGVTPVV